MYKSLEHIIREIKEGKNILEKKKDSLEGAIRKVQRKEYESSYAARDSKPVDEDDIKLPKDYDESIEEMNVVTNTGGEMLGRQFNTRAAIIAPRKDSDDGHGQSAKNVSMQRRSQIQKFSSRNVSDGGKISEEKLIEAPVKFKTPKVKTPEIKGSIEFAVPQGGPVVPYQAPKTPLAKPKIPSDLIYPETKVSPKLAEPETKVVREPVTQTPTKLAEPETKVVREPVTQTPTKLTEPTPVKPAEPQTKVKPVETVPVKPKLAEPPVKPTVPGKPPIKGLPLPFGLGAAVATAKPVELTGPHPPVKTSLGRHIHIRATKNVYKEEVESSERKKIQDMPRKDAGDRHNVEYIGRKNADPKSTAEKTSRQAQYKIKVIDEAKKLADVVKKVRKESGDGQTKVYDNVIINPNLKRELDPEGQIREGLGGWLGSHLGGATGGAAGVGAGPNLPSAYQKYKKGDTLGAAKQVGSDALQGVKDAITEPYEKYKKGDKVGAAISAGQWFHTPTMVSKLAGDILTGSETGRKIGKAIGDYVPGAKEAAEKAKEFRSKLGIKSAVEPQETEITPKPVKTTVEKPDSSFVSSKPRETEIVPRPVKTTIEPESGGKKRTVADAYKDSRNKKK